MISRREFMKTALMTVPVVLLSDNSTYAEIPKLYEELFKQIDRTAHLRGSVAKTSRIKLSKDSSISLSYFISSSEFAPDPRTPFRPFVETIYNYRLEIKLRNSEKDVTYTDYGAYTKGGPFTSKRDPTVLLLGELDDYSAYYEKTNQRVSLQKGKKGFFKYNEEYKRLAKSCLYRLSTMPSYPKVVGLP